MQLEIFQWLVPLIGIFYISRTILQYSRNRRSARGTVVWIVFWLCIIVLAAVPNFIAVNIAKVLGFKDVVNAVIFVAIGLIFLFIFYLSTTIEKLETQLTELVRQIAIDELTKEQNGRSEESILKHKRNVKKRPKTKV